MSYPTNKKIVEIEKRRRDVASLYLGGSKQWQIAEQLGYDRTTISKDLKALKDQWASSAKDDINSHISITLAKLDQLENYAMKMFAEASRVGKAGGNTAGYWHKEVLETIDRKTKLLGLNKPSKFELDANMKHDIQNPAEMSDEELQQAIENELTKLIDKRNGTGEPSD
ncbi:MAG: hypothetical protein WCS62_04925 [Bacilli bacterium]